MEQFALQLEQRMVQGEPHSANLAWARAQGVDEDTVKVLTGIIRQTWHKEIRTYKETCELRDELRAKYFEVYRLSIVTRSLGTAIKAIDSIARLDGVDQPQQMNVTITPATSGQVTSFSRDNVNRLITKMRELADQDQKSLKAVIDVIELNGKSHEIEGEDL